MTTKTISNTTGSYYYYGNGVTLTNAGVQGAPGLSDQNWGVEIGGDTKSGGNNDTLVNRGTILGERIGVYIKGGTGDTVINEAGKLIAGDFYPGQGGVTFESTRGTIINYGTISGPPIKNGESGNGVELRDGGLLTNFGTVLGGGALVGNQAFPDAVGTVVNSGVILGNANYGAVYMAFGGTITNLAGGRISANGATSSYGGAPAYGIFIKSGPGTVTNAGTIDGNAGAGGNAILLGANYQNRVIADPGAVFLGTVNGGTAADATLELASGSSTGTLSGFGSQFTNFGSIAFDPNASWLLETNTAIASTHISGFAQGDTIDVTGFTATNVGDVGGVTTVTLTNSGGTHLVVNLGAPAGNVTIASGPGIDGTEITTICFCRDTQIGTPSGEVPVQTLKAGDMVLTAHNGPRKVTWVGTGKVLATRGKRGVATPVIVRKGALGDNVPNRDLHVTKAHSLYLDDVLIPVEFLVNHRTILWDDRAQEVEIYHVELESHDILIANGVPAESYRDDGNRWLFQNANEGWHLPPQEPYAPVLTGGPIVDAVWQRLLDRAGPRDTGPLTDDPDLHLVVDGKRVDAQERTGSVYIFRLPAAPASVAVASRTGVPSELGITRDPRALGVALRRVAIRQGSKFMLFDADDERLTTGFHGYEPTDNLRWTDGHAELPIEAFARFDKGAEVMLHLGGATRYPDDREDAGQAAA
ncbi:Hint domain-containing protein [Acidisphaera sp. S103]|uniref:Hint domain-containing protein n=1 Tax=Acidisphaera sp. S103 TaxID=1747223 RepID=UPI00131D65B0|nr:Hint domain-containing protein [Acidisphaera sp. S103]